MAGASFLSKGTRKVGLSPSGYDDIGSVLEALKLGLDVHQVDFDTLRCFADIESFDVLFLNCSAAIEPQSATIAPAVRQYVEGGGTLYASDHAGSVLEHAFKSDIGFDRDGEAGTQTCRVNHSGLRQYIGDELDLEFDLPAWWRVTRVSPNTTVLMEAEDGEPVLCQFAHGAGNVIYTAFHNKAQTNANEQRLLEYLVIAPIVARASRSIKEEITKGSWNLRSEIVDILSGDGQANAYEFPAPKPGNYSFIFSPNYACKVDIAVHTAVGDLLKEESGFRAPGSLQVTKSGSDNLVLRIGLSERSPSNVPFAFFCVDGGDLAGETTSAPAAAAPTTLRIRTRAEATGEPSAPVAGPTLRVKVRTRSETDPVITPRLVLPKKDKT